MKRMMTVTEEPRERQLEYNRAHGIKPVQIVKEIQQSLVIRKQAQEVEEGIFGEDGEIADVQAVILDMEKEMLAAAEALEFERAALLRDQLHELRTAGSLTRHKGKTAESGKGTYSIRGKKRGGSWKKKG